MTSGGIGKKELSIKASKAKICLAYLYPAQATHLSYNFLIIFGYSGWGRGQLEGEMERDHWILSDIDLNITFDEESNTKWDKAYKNSFIKI